MRPIVLGLVVLITGIALLTADSGNTNILFIGTFLTAFGGVYTGFWMWYMTQHNNDEDENVNGTK